MHFDRIICDVPCSSDAAIRKIPKKWDTWDTNDGASLHPLQLKILLRSLMMLNPYTDDAYLTYSTWSLNPIENEAVVYAALQKVNSDPAFGGEYELIDWRDKLLPFKTRKGLCKWSVFDSLAKHRRKRSQKEREKIQEAKRERNKAKKEENDIDLASEGNSDNVAIGIESENDDASQNQEEPIQEENERKEQNDNEEMKEENEEETEQKEPVFEEYFKEYKTFNDVAPDRQNRYKASFFPPEGTEDEIDEKYHLSRCIRVFANDQDTSGFFIALFKRKAISKSNVVQEENKEEKKVENNVVAIQKPLKNLIRCDPTDPDIEFITTYYGLTKDFPVDQIFTYSSTMNKLMVINRGLSDVLYADQEKQLNLVAAGAETFIRNTSKTYGGTECIFRISQNGVYHVYPFMTKRILKIDLDMFLLLLDKQKIEFNEIPESEFKESVMKLTWGCFVVVTSINETQEEVMVLHRHFHHLNTMISELNLHKIKTCLNKEF